MMEICLDVPRANEIRFGQGTHNSRLFRAGFGVVKTVLEKWELWRALKYILQLQYRLTMFVLMTNLKP
jgi:hypothetical protein